MMNILTRSSRAVLLKTGTLPVIRELKRLSFLMTDKTIGQVYLYDAAQKLRFFARVQARYEITTS